MNHEPQPITEQLTDTAPENHDTLHDRNPVWTAKALRPLTRKQQAFTNHLIEHPKDSATKAVKAVYGKEGKPVTELSARAIASENLTKPNILLELAKHSATAELTLIEVMQYSKEYGRQGGKEGASYASVASSTANSLLDRIHGKAKQTIEQQTTAVVINVDLTGVTPATTT